MATSGSYDYSVTAADIIQAALEDIGVIADGASVNASDAALCLKRLNFIAKQFQGKADKASGLKVWTRKRLTLFLAKGRHTYQVGPASGDSPSTLLYGRTTVSADEALGQTTISITSNTDTTTNPGTTVTMTAADVIGIELDSGAIHWAAISGTPSTTATITVALPSAASAGNYIYWYTAKGQRFPVIEYAVLRDSNGTDTPLYIYRDVQEYEAIADKTADGSPTSILIEPQRITTQITFDSQPDDVTEQVVMTVLYPAEDYDSSANDIAFPQEWFAALEWELAFRIAPAFTIKWTEAMQANYMQAMSIARDLNAENTSLYYQPGID
jgi:hypothetical protein